MSARIPRQLLLRVVPEQCLHMQQELAPCTTLMFGPSCKHTSAGMLNSQETSGLTVCMLLPMLQLSQMSETDEQTPMCSCKHGALLEPQAGCWLWPLVLQNPGSAHADANRRLRSAQHNHLLLMLGPGWQILSAQEPILVKPVFFLHRDWFSVFSQAGIHAST